MLGLRMAVRARQLGATGALALILLLGIALDGAAGLTIGFSQVGHRGSWRPAVSENMQEVASQMEIDLRFADAADDQNEQLKAVRAFIAQKVDAIIIAPVLLTGWDQVLAKAKRAGIPVFLMDRDVDVSDRSLYVTRFSSDFAEEGRLAGTWLAEASNGRCNILELEGIVNTVPAIERHRGFRAAISGFPGMKIVKRQSGNFTTEGGEDAMWALIRSTHRLKGICAVFAQNDNMQIGAIQAMKDAGLKPGTDILMVSIDYIPAMEEALAAGEANASVEMRSAIAKYIYPVIADYLKAPKKLPKVTVIPPDLHTADEHL